MKFVTRFLILAVLLCNVVHAGLGRHNEQGLSPTHSYKRSGDAGVVSNLNGNLVLNTSLATVGNPLSAVLTRSWNSHWRDPLIVHQYDMDYTSYNYGGKGSPQYRDRDLRTSNLKARELGEFVRRTVQRYDGPEGIPLNAELARSIAATTVSAMVKGHVNLAIQIKYQSTIASLEARSKLPAAQRSPLTAQEFSDVKEMQKVEAGLALFGGVMQSIASGGEEFKALNRCLEGKEKPEDDCVLNAMGMFNQFGGDKFLNAGLTELAGKEIDIPFVGIASTGYYLSKGDYDQVAIAVGSMFADKMFGPYAAIPKALMTGDMTNVAWATTGVAAHVFMTQVLGYSAGGPATMAVGLTIQLTRMAIEKAIADDKTFDVGWVGATPWALGVNGYLGMVGTNHDPDRSGANKRFQWRWDETRYYPQEEGDTTDPVPYLVSLNKSRHPMPDLQLMGADGGATRFILADDSAITDSAGRRWVAYTALSNAERRKVYYCVPSRDDVIDLGTDPENLQTEFAKDEAGFYLVKEPNGTQVTFRTKGIDEDHANTSTYWAVPTGVRHATGDSLQVQRTGTRLEWVRDPRTQRGILVERGPVVRTPKQVALNGVYSFAVLEEKSWNETLISGLLDASGRVIKGIDTVVQHFEEKSYESYKGEKEVKRETFPALVWEARRGGYNANNQALWDTTRYVYSDGDLTEVQSAEGSRTTYRYAATRHDPRDGFVLESVEYPDAKSTAFYRQTLYDYVGWDDARPQMLRTNVTTKLVQPDYLGQNLSSRTSQINDSYLFGAMRFGVNVNRSLAGVPMRMTVYEKDSLFDTTKTVDSLEYSTVRYELQAEIHGAGSPSQRRVQTIWNGDLRIGQIESRGLGRMFDPRVKVWTYDVAGNVLQERVCPAELMDSIKTRLQGTDVGWKGCPEVRTDYTQTDNADGEFWTMGVDTLRVKTGKYPVPVGIRNPKFNPARAYQTGLATSQRVYRTGSRKSDSVVVADSTVYETVTAYQRWMRPTSSLAWIDGQWVETGRTGYHDKSPTLATKSWRKLGGDSASFTKTDFDNDLLFPLVSHAYVNAATMGQEITGTELKTQFSYTPEGWINSVTDAAGNKTDSTRDRRGRVITVTRADGSQITTKYQDRLESWQGQKNGYPWLRSLAVTETDPSGVQTTARFDGVGRMLGVVKRASGTPADSQVALTSYNVFNKLSWKRDGDGREEFHDYDLEGRLKLSQVFQERGGSSGAALSWQKTYAWDDEAHTLTEADELGTKTVFHWDGHGRDTLIVRDAGRFATNRDAASGDQIKVRQKYDNLGNLIQLVDPKGLIETRQYDGRNRLTETVYPDDLRHAVEYDVAGRVVRDTLFGIRSPFETPSSTAPQDERITKSLYYDAVDRVVSESYGSGARENVDFVWGTTGDQTGRLLAVQRGTGLTAQYAYDVLGRRTSRDVNLPGIVKTSQAWGYDVSGAPIRQELPGGGGFGYGYDRFHRLGSIRFGKGTDSVTILSEAKYLGNDLLTGYRLGQRLRVRYGYEPVRSVLTSNVVERTTSLGAVVDTVYRQNLSWDDAGNVSGMRRHSGDSLSFGMDRLYQLRSVDYGDGGALRTDYDANGNRLRHDHPMAFGKADSFTYTANRVGTARTARNGFTTYRHDALGNLAVEANFASVADTGDVKKAWRVIERRWNKRSELERARVITRLDGADTVNLRYEYGEDGNRVASLVAVGSDTTKWTVTHRWVYDGTSIVADSGTDHSWQWHAFQGLNRVAEIADTGALRVRYVVTDHQGSTQLLLTETAGVLGKWVWDPWGNLEYARTDATTELLYQGKTYEPKLGEWYFNARWYSPERGSFTGRDPKEQFYSPYNYVGNGPLVGIDPDGNETAMNVDGNGVITDIQFTDNRNSTVTINVYDGSGNYSTQLIAREPDRGSYFYERNSDGNFKVIGQQFMGNITNLGEEHLNYAWSLYPFDGYEWRSRGELDFKTQYGVGVGILYGTAMTTRDAGNALWGGWVRYMYGFSYNVMNAVSNGVANGREDYRSAAMQRWGWRRNFGQ